MTSFALAAIRLMAITVMTLALMPVQLIVVAIAPRYYSAIPLRFHRMICKFGGLQITVKGDISAVKPTLFICNHSSYLDIIILSALMPTSFVAKAEIASWPLFGWLGKLQKTVFIERRRSQAKKHVDAVTQSLQAGRNLVVFPEGTSSDQNRVLPFKPTLFRVADTMIDGRPITVQPVCISFVEINGLPVGRNEKPFFAWYGDMDLIPHLWEFLSLGRTHVVVEFFPAITRAQFADHKSMAQYSQRLLASSLSSAVTGKSRPVPTMPPISAQLATA